MSHLTNRPSRWDKIYILGGVAALGSVVGGLLEIAISFFPGGSIIPVTVQDWFALYQAYPFMGMRDMGLMNIFLVTLGIPIYFALYAAFREDLEGPIAALLVIISFIGTGVFFATNRAFAMLALSQQYAAATSEATRTILEAAGQAVLAVGASHSAGTFLGFFLSEIVGISLSVLMLRSVVFNKATAITGILGWGILGFHEILTSFGTGVNQATVIVAIPGGLCMLAWFILLAVRFFRLGANRSKASDVEVSTVGVSHGNTF